MVDDREPEDFPLLERTANYGLYSAERATRLEGQCGKIGGGVCTCGGYGGVMFVFAGFSYL